MNYLSTLFFSLGFGLSSIHTDFNTQPLSAPFLSYQTSLRAEFNKQALSLNFFQYQGELKVSNWAIPSSGGPTYSIVNRVFTLQVEQQLFDFNRNGTMWLGAGLAFGKESGLGFNSSFHYRRCILCSFDRRLYLSFNLELSYWGEDGLEGYVNSGDVVGDFGLRSLVSLEIPLTAGRIRPLSLR